MENPVGGKPRSRVVPIVLAGFALLVVAAGYAGYRHFSGVFHTITVTHGTATGGESANGYYNLITRFTGERNAHWVPFTFDRPDKWEIYAGTHVLDQTNFVETFREMQLDGKARNVEEFQVRPFHSDTNSAERAIPECAAQFAGEFGEKMRAMLTDFRVVSQGPAKFKTFNAYEYRAQGTAKTDDGAAVQMYLRWIMTAQHNEAHDGVILVLRATSRSPDIHGLDDMGTTGGLKQILDSFSYEWKQSSINDQANMDGPTWR